MVIRSVRIEITGVVQGVGFRPFVAHLAIRHAIVGSILNDGRGVTITAQGEAEAVAGFLAGLCAESPPLARIERMTVVEQPPARYDDFRILQSNHDGAKTVAVPPDAHLCDDCLREMLDPQDRRYRYPFINCTNCGPRFSLITSIPYDRPLTTMADFAMCADCRAEYADPASRRYHAQPIACPACGPSLRLLDRDGTPLDGSPLLGAIARLRRGEVVAIKGLGGYHLAVDPRNEAAVMRLRQRKNRDEKPFALMAASLAAARDFVQVDEIEAHLLAGVERPVVLLEQRHDHGLAAGVAPKNRYFGVMLPYTPLHHLLLREGGFSALIMTSGNRSDEPIAYDDADALLRLRDLADVFLVHNRRIHIRVDDSIVRVMAGRPLVLRRARGYVPRHLLLTHSGPEVLALGGELKNTLTFLRPAQAVLSQHLGDLATVESCTAQGEMIAHFQRVLELRPTIVAHDLHPDYHTTRLAEEMTGVSRCAVQHHHAHLVSCLAENGFDGPALGVIFDGTGFGNDGRIWGGEFLLGDRYGFQRLAHWEWLPLPGGDAATREPWRVALAALYGTYGAEIPELTSLLGIPAEDRRVVLTMLARQLHTPLTSSCGRLFDAVAALVGLRTHVTYEGQAALELEMCAESGEVVPYPFDLIERDGVQVIDHRPLFAAIVSDLQRGETCGGISARFHRTVAEAALVLCRRIRRTSGVATVALSGGVFQNRLLTETLVSLLQADDFEVLTHSLVPPNDGGLSLGQAVIAGSNHAASVPAVSG